MPSVLHVLLAASKRQKRFLQKLCESQVVGMLAECQIEKAKQLREIILLALLQRGAKHEAIGRAMINSFCMPTDLLCFVASANIDEHLGRL